MTIFLVRHTRVNIPPGTCYGQSDIPLADTFEAEAARVLEKLQKLNPGNCDIISSPLSRCTRLAEKISPAYRTDSRLMELNFGEWELHHWDTIDRVKSEEWMADYVNRRCPGGESYSDMAQRVEQFAHELSQMGPPDKIIVTHSGVIRLFRAWTLRLPLNNTFDFGIDYGTLFSLELNSGIFSNFQSLG